MAEDLIERIERTRHFGELFLLWLWYHAIEDETVFRLSDGTALELAIDNQLTLELPLDKAEKLPISGAAPAESPEAFLGLKQGKVVSQAKIRIQRDEKEWIFTLTGKTLAISGLKIPALMTKADDEKIYERQALIEEVDALMRGLYESFLNIRLSPGWKAEQNAIIEWVKNHTRS